MKGGVIFLFLSFLLVNFISAETSLSPSDVSVIVDTTAPIITIITPKNNTTYNNAAPLLINYTIIDPTLDSTWYSLNSQPNITIIGPFSLNLAEGDYHLVIYANDSFNRINFSEVYFNMNASAALFCGDTTCNYPDESCSNCPSDCGSCPPAPPSGGGGGRITKRVRDFSIDKKEIKISLKQGETKTEQITIKNEESVRLSFLASIINLEDFIKMSEDEFKINSKQEKTIILDFIARETVLPDLYVGKIVVKSGDTEKEVLIAIEIETKYPLFDVELEIPKKYRYVLPGEEILANIELFNIGETGKVDTEVNYIIKNEIGEEILSEKETVAVETRMALSKSFQLPEDIEYGDYLFYAKIKYNGESASASAWFSVGEKPFSTYYKQFLIYGIIILIILILIIRLNKMKKYKKVGDLKIQESFISRFHTNIQLLIQELKKLVS